MSKSIFTTRFRECCKELKFTQDEMAKKLNISLDGLKHYLRKDNNNLPPAEQLIKMAEIFGVDVDYLINEHRICKNYRAETVHDATFIGENASEVLCHLYVDEAEVLGCILTHPDFRYLLSNINHFVRFSRNESFVTFDEGTKDFESINIDMETNKALKKFIITDTFSRMLDGLYHIYDDLEFEIMKLKDEYLDTITYFIEVSEDRIYIDELIIELQEKLKKLDPNDSLCSYSTQEFIDNIEYINKSRT